MYLPLLFPVVRPASGDGEEGGGEGVVGSAGSAEGRVEGVSRFCLRGWRVGEGGRGG